MKKMKQAELKKIVDKADVTPIEDRKGWSNVHVTVKNLNKLVAVESTVTKEARELALEAIVNEPVGIRGFALDTDKE